MKKKTSPYILIPLLFLILFLFHRKDISCESRIIYIEQEFKGLIIKKYFEKLTKIEIKIADSIYNLSFLSADLLEKAEVGDTIIKIINRNFCILKNNYKTDTIEYIYIPENCLNGLDSNIYKKNF